LFLLRFLQVFYVYVIFYAYAIFFMLLPYPFAIFIRLSAALGWSHIFSFFLLFL